MANGYYVQETHIENRFLDLGHDVTKRKDYQIWGSTNLLPRGIDGFGDHTYPGSGLNGEIELWHTISVWNGQQPPYNTPYGVYTGKEVIPWP